MESSFKDECITGTCVGFVFDYRERVKWDKTRVYSAEEAVDMTRAMKDGAWKGRVYPDELEALKRVIMGCGQDYDFKILEGHGVYPKEGKWEY
jgi:hypothetical protein